MGDLQGLAVFDESSDSVVAFAGDGRYLYANPSALRLLEVPDVLGRTVQEFAEACASDIGSPDAGPGESVIRTASGRLTPVRYRSTANYLPDVHVSIMQPIERRKNHRENPRAELFHAVFENAPYAFMLADDSRGALDGNRAARHFLGLSREALATSRIDDFMPEAMRAGLGRTWETFLATGTMQGLFPILLGNGLQRTVLFRAKANVRPGRHLGTFQLARAGQENGAAAPELSVSAGELTSREREVLTLLARGSSARAIAEAATLSPDTVRTHLRNAMKKLGARSRPHAIALAIRHREIDP
jgi:DNA-binding CsgD family transcriptional regulator/PAS domain-containing protein